MPEFPDVELEALPKTLEAKVPKEYIDVMGHMNVAWYTHYFSESMLGLYRHLGFDLDELKERHWGSFALETHIRYFREIRAGHRIDVFTRLISRNQKRVHVISFIKNRDLNEVSASHEVVAICVDLRERKPALIPEAMGAEMDAMIACDRLLDWNPPLCGVMGVR